MVSGGFPAYRTAEIYHPGSVDPSACTLPQLPDLRNEHTQFSTGLICSGDRDSQLTNCIQWENNAWRYTNITLRSSRRYSSKWRTPDDKLIFFGGGETWETYKNAEMIKPDGTTEILGFTFYHGYL